MSGLDTSSSGHEIGIAAQFQPLILILGAGEAASGAAYRLVKAGLRVVMTEQAHPSMARMCVSYGSCIQHRAVVIEGIIARRATVDTVPGLLADGVIPVLNDPDATSIHALHPAALIDARNAGMQPTMIIDAASLVIGIGPGFTIGKDCHAVIESERGHFLGRVFWENHYADGFSSDNSQVAEDCVLRAPADGMVVQTKVIGCHVKTGMVIARVGGLPVIAPFDGVVCGLVDDDVYVTAGRKIGDLDPCIKRENCFTLSDRALAIGGGAVEAVLSTPRIRQLVIGQPNGQRIVPAEQVTS